jgi:hypothetical protein
MQTPGLAVPLGFSPPAGLTTTDRSCATYAMLDGSGRPPAVTSASHSVGSAAYRSSKSSGTDGVASGCHTIVHGVVALGVLPALYTAPCLLMSSHWPSLLCWSAAIELSGKTSPLSRPMFTKLQLAFAVMSPEATAYTLDTSMCATTPLRVGSKPMKSRSPMASEDALNTGPM